MKKKFKTALFEIRRKKELTQKNVAEGINASVQQISALENGERKLSPEWLERLSKFLGCTKAELLGEAPQQELDEDERILIETFRQLAPEKKSLLIQTAEAFAKG